jgi:hypothetical protein
LLGVKRELKLKSCIAWLHSRKRNFLSRPDKDEREVSWVLIFTSVDGALDEALEQQRLI